jgi:hypothetical protein
MTWCNLYSTASKFNLCIKESLYRKLFLLSGCISLGVLLVIYTTYAYQFALVAVVVMLTIISIVISKTESRQPTPLQLRFDEDGACSFESTLKESDESSNDVKKHFQLLASSRYSFFGCWLHMVPLSSTHIPNHLPDGINNIFIKKWLFIYRDSLTDEDFSRLSQMIRKLQNAT